MAVRAPAAGLTLRSFSCVKLYSWIDCWTLACWCDFIVLENRSFRQHKPFDRCKKKFGFIYLDGLVRNSWRRSHAPELMKYDNFIVSVNDEHISLSLSLSLLFFLENNPLFPPMTITVTGGLWTIFGWFMFIYIYYPYEWKLAVVGVFKCVFDCCDTVVCLTQ